MEQECKKEDIIKYPYYPPDAVIEWSNSMFRSVLVRMLRRQEPEATVPLTSTVKSRQQ